MCLLDINAPFSMDPPPLISPHSKFQHCQKPAPPTSLPSRPQHHSLRPQHYANPHATQSLASSRFQHHSNLGVNHNKVSPRPNPLQNPEPLKSQHHPDPSITLSQHIHDLAHSLSCTTHGKNIQSVLSKSKIPSTSLLSIGTTAVYYQISTMYPSYSGNPCTLSPASLLYPTGKHGCSSILCATVTNINVRNSREWRFRSFVLFCLFFFRKDNIQETESEGKILLHHSWQKVGCQEHLCRRERNGSKFVFLSGTWS